LSSDPNRPRPRSSKKRRVVQSGVAGGGRPNRASTQRARAGATRGGNASGGIPTAAWAVAAVVVFAIGVALASGAISFGGGGSAESPARSDEPLPSAVARGTNCPTSQPPAAPAGTVAVVSMQTDKGQIQITLDADLSPIAVGNFSALVACGFYDGTVFHRVATLQDGTPFVIQGGDPEGTGGGGPGYEIQDEPVTTKYVRGTVAMARSAAPNSAGSQFFIVLDDKDQSLLQSANTYQIIGSVTGGMDVVDAIYAAAGGQENPANPVAMTKVTIGPPTPRASSSAPASGAPPSPVAPSAGPS
jgi:cyclophilin family peptidyl-prolyl cis-trans isomerase